MPAASYGLPHYLRETTGRAVALHVPVLSGNAGIGISHLLLKHQARMDILNIIDRRIRISGRNRNAAEAIVYGNRAIPVDCYFPGLEAIVIEIHEQRSAVLLVHV